MATDAQKKALQQAQTTLDSSKTAQAASQAAYNQARTNYTTLANQGYQQSSATQGQLKQYNSTMSAAQAVLSKGVNYTNKYDDKIAGLLDKAENGKMQYSVTDDPAYKALQNTYVNQGRTAMQNAVGEAVAATGGYGSTAAAAAGQVAYNQSLTELNGHVAGLYDAAAARFNNQQNLLVTLADSYRQLDAQGWEQAYNEWNSQYNGYVQLADEYLKGYEYMDDADRKAYETRLDAYWNVLTSAQSQYNTDQSMTQQALAAYTKQTNDIANYDETVRANLANEALAKAQLEETVRANKASEAQAAAALAASQVSGGSSSGITTYNSNNTKKFIASIRTQEEFARRQGTSDYKNYGNYKNYVAAMLQQFLENKQITEADAAYLCKYYKLEQ